jgi:predicted nucleic acid-binding protein
MSQELVVDASVIIDMLIPNARSEQALSLVEGCVLYAPSIVDLEVLSGVARLERSGAITNTEAQSAINNWRQTAVDKVPSDQLVERVWSLRNSVRISDAFYLALAESYSLPLVTSDQRLSRAPHPGVAVTVVC